MFRSVIVHLVAAVVWGCPYLCLSSSAAPQGSGIARKVTTGCPCCSHPVPKDDKKSPSQPSPRQGGSCLCHGAIVNRPAGAPTPEPTAVFTVLAGAESLVGSMLVTANGLSASRGFWNLPGADSGKELRALISSFLF